eukprot:CAMPEP_0175788646 /NCGR_PEP_ID=MMETSP0097-20121207/80991_1 /TAXON_ID=311494 /ORGANISM="Alexandrium monilatum, Strain CCMP3105" /LENGTH=75 /DNA_ID=CAMNT_0017099675 /DNA_START=152 /DNA_END=375 /DNA_ORIENTATION=-
MAQVLLDRGASPRVAAFKLNPCSPDHNRSTPAGSDSWPKDLCQASSEPAAPWRGGHQWIRRCRQSARHRATWAWP